MIARVDTRSIRDTEYFTLSKAAEILGCSYELLRRARNDGRLLTLRENPAMTTGSQLIAFIESPRKVKSMKKF